MTLLLRLGAYTSSRHLSFDDGVYGASAVAMRAGGVPFREVFSSQGPLFLPLVYLGDLLGLRNAQSPRLLALAAGVSLVLATWSIARRLAPGGRALVAPVLVATSGSVLSVTGPLTSDGPALALATVAVALALAHRHSPSLPRSLLVGVAVGAAMSVKSLLLGAAVAVAVAMWRRPGHLVLAALTSALFGLAVTLPFGLAAVWDQSVAYHLEASGDRTPGANAVKVLWTLSYRDFPLLALAGVALAGVLFSRRARRSGRQKRAKSWPVGDRGPVAAWLVATAVVLALEHPLWRNHVAHLVPPAAILLCSAPIKRRILVGWLAVSLSIHSLLIVGLVLPAPAQGAEAAATADLASLPAGALAISDEPGLVWRAGRRTPADLVDTSILRIRGGRIDARTLAEQARAPGVCAVLVWSERFGGLAGLPGRLVGYRPARNYGRDRVLYTRPCSDPPGD